jgi:hypothetical protein
MMAVTKGHAMNVLFNLSFDSQEGVFEDTSATSENRKFFLKLVNEF